MRRGRWAPAELDLAQAHRHRQAAIWEMNGTNAFAGGSVGANPGSSWRTIA
jgi:hypothetical protein